MNARSVTEVLATSGHASKKAGMSAVSVSFEQRELARPGHTPAARRWSSDTVRPPSDGEMVRSCAISARGCRRASIARVKRSRRLKPSTFSG